MQESLVHRSRRLRTLSVAAGGEWLDGALFGMEYVTTPTTVQQMFCPIGLENSNLDEAVWRLSQDIWI